VGCLVSQNPNFFPYDGAQFCRPNWYPNNKVQAYAGGLEALQAKNRLAQQLKIDAIVDQADEADTIQELGARRQMVKNSHTSCNCGAPEIQPRSVLQPTGIAPLPLQGDSIRPGGIGDWWNDYIVEPVQEFVDGTAQAIGQGTCDALNAAGITQPAKELAVNALNVVTDTQNSPDRAYSYAVDLVAGPVPFFMSELLETCDLGPAIKNGAAAESRRMGIYYAVFSTMAQVAAIPGIAAAAPTAGVALLPAAKAQALALTTKALEGFWLAVSKGRWLSFEEMSALLASLNNLTVFMDGSPNAGFSEAMTSALENSATVSEAYANAQNALAQVAQTTNELQEIERAFLQIGVDAQSGTLAAQGVPSQPSAINPNMSVFPAPFNPMITRPVLEMPATTQPYPEAGQEAPAATGGGAFPIVGLGLLLGML